MEGTALAVPDLLFYDGHCGLCHRAVVFILKRDHGYRFQFAPLQGTTLRERLTPERIAALPDSLVVLAGGELRVKSRAVAHLLLGLGGAWARAGRLVSWIPAILGDAIYDLVAATRHRLFSPPAGTCPLVPTKWQGRFLP